MKLPATLTIAGLRYTISTDRLEVAEEGHEQRATLCGSTDRRKQRILIETRQHDQQIAETLVHEVLHVLTQVAGLADEWDHDHEEAVVNRLAPVLTQTLATNPELLEALRDAWDPAPPRCFP